LECGNGTGNTIYPVVKFTPENLVVHAFDMSDTAIKLVLKHENYTPERVGAYACDILKENPKKLVDSLSCIHSAQ